jgi:hypothetical protein
MKRLFFLCRINNWLTKRGYDLKAERERWYKRIEAAKKK